MSRNSKSNRPPVSGANQNTPNVQGQGKYAPNAQPGGYRPAYTPQAGGRGEGTVRQAPASGQYSRNNPQYSRGKRKSNRGKKIAIGMVSVLLLAVLGCGTAFALYFDSINKELAGNKTEEEMMVIKDSLVPTKNFTDPFYLMLVGSDRREDNSVEGQRSDTNILCRIDPMSSLITMISIPRDTKIEVDGGGVQKFNAAYNYGGVASTISEASQLCGVDISHYAEVNFEELVELVDAVGGVDVEVVERIEDADAGSIVIEAGLQHLNGEAALVFARSRAYADGDFTRASNQRLLVEALVNKVLSLPVNELPAVIQKAAKCVTTDFSLNDILSLATQFHGAGELTVYSAMVPSTIPPLIDGISYVVADQAALNQMMKVVEAGGDPNTIATTSAIGSSLYVTPDGGLPNTDSGANNSGTSEGSGYYEEPYNNSL